MTASDPAPVQIDYAPPEAPPHVYWQRKLYWRVVGWLIIAVVLIAAAVGGLRVREWAFVSTSPIRFNGDVNRGFGWGYYNFHNGFTRQRGYFETYDDVANEHGVQDRSNPNYIDYAPLRLAVMTLWARYNHTHGFAYQRRPPTPRTPASAAELDRELAFHRFPLTFNTCMEVTGVIAAFLIVHFVVRRSRARRSLPVEHFTGVPQALAAALLLWFNPAMIQSAHTWITWDMWIVPPFLWAVYFGCRRWWFCAGLMIAIGALFKGQQFFVTPMFLLWPLFQGRWRSSLRCLAGLLIGFAVLTSPWTLATVEVGTHVPRHWVKSSLAYTACVLLATIALPLLRRLILRKFTDNRQIWWAITITAGIAAIALTVWPAYGQPLAFKSYGTLALALALLAAAATTVIPLRAIPVLAAGVLGAAMILCTPLFNLSYAWFDASYMFGTDHWERGVMVMGLSDNLPGILSNRYGWGDPLDVVFTWHDTPVTMKMLLFSIFLVLMVLTSAGVAMHDRRASTRFLVAVVTPWLLFFTFPAQIHERYLLSGAAAAMICIGQSLGMTLLALFLSILAALMPLHVMLRHGANINGIATPAWPTMGRDVLWFLDGTFPEMGWAVILATMVFFYFAVTPLWQKRPRQRVRDEQSPAAPALFTPTPAESDPTPQAPA